MIRHPPIDGSFGRSALRPVAWALCAAVIAAVIAAASPARAPTIIPFTCGAGPECLGGVAGFDSWITGSANATGIESSINSAIATPDGLYSNNVTLDAVFGYSTVDLATGAS